RNSAAITGAVAGGITDGGKGAEGFMEGIRGLGGVEEVGRGVVEAVERGGFEGGVKEGFPHLGLAAVGAGGVNGAWEGLRRWMVEGGVRAGLVEAAFLIAAVGVAKLGKVRGGEDVLGWERVEEIEDIGALVYLGVFADFNEFDEGEGEGWVRDDNRHVTILHRSKVKGFSGGRDIPFGKVRVAVGDLRENDMYRVGRVRLEGRSDLVQIAAAVGQTLHVTLRRREGSEARGSVELLGAAEGAGEGKYKTVEGYVGVCLEMPDGGGRVVCRDMEEVERALCAGGRGS
ncbi:hypothetical protein TrRE_jg143, partial [Triparma retinervis]